MGRCSQCGASLEAPRACSYCGDDHCSEHRLPEAHDCPSVETDGEWFDSSLGG